MTLRFSVGAIITSHKHTAAAARPRSQATTATAASFTRYIIPYSVQYYRVPRFTARSNVSRPLFHICYVMRSRLRGESYPYRLTSTLSANSFNFYLSTSEKKTLSRYRSRIVEDLRQARICCYKSHISLFMVVLRVPQHYSAHASNNTST